jgi:hypothetical protein
LYAVYVPIFDKAEKKRLDFIQIQAIKFACLGLYGGLVKSEPMVVAIFLRVEADDGPLASGN